MQKVKVRYEVELKLATDSIVDIDSIVTNDEIDRALTSAASDSSLMIYDYEVVERTQDPESLEDKEYLVVKCPECKQRQKLPKNYVESGQPTCGRCRDDYQDGPVLVEVEEE